MITNSFGNKRTAQLPQRVAENAHGNAPRVPEDLEALSPEAARQLLRDLVAYQAELETQNVLTQAEVTERIRAMEALEAERDRTQQYLDLAGSILVSLAADQTITLINKRGCELLGYNQEELIGRNWFDTVLPEGEREKTRAVFDQLIRGELQPVEFVKNFVVTRGGEVRMIGWHNSPVRDASGNIIGTLSSGDDITERMQMEQALRDSEETMRYIVKHDPNAIAVYDRDMHYIAVSDRFLQDYNVKEEDIIGKHHYKVFPEMPQKWKDVHQRCLAGAIEHNDDDYFVRPDGSITYNRWECRPWRRVDGKIGGIITYTEVTTERKKAEKALRESEALFRRMFDRAPIGAAMVSLDFRYLMVNEALCHITGYTAEELTGRRVSDISHPDDNADIAQARRLAAGEIDNFDIDKRYLRPDGSAVWIHLNVGLIRDEDGRALYFLPMMADITERKRAEEALRESEAKYRRLHETMMDAFVSINMAGSILEFNSSYVAMLGYTAEELRRLTYKDITPEKWYALESQIIDDQIMVRGFSDVYEKEYRRKDGTVFPVELRTVLLKDAEGRAAGMWAVVRDITERKRMENDLRAADRQKDEFLAMLAHELRNPLAPIRNANAVIDLTSSQNPALARQCGIINRQVGHMARLIDDLLDVSRITRGEIHLRKNSLDLREVLDQAIESTQDLFLKRQQDLTYAKPEKPIVVNGDFTRLVQVIYNLLLNANKYTEPGGRIAIEISRESGTKTLPAGKVVVRIRDTGIGISQDYLAHVFDLFSQAEKNLDRSHGGLGIGLTLVKRLVEMHGGMITVSSKGLGHGSEFTVHLPLEPGAGDADDQRGTASSIANRDGTL